MAKKKSSKLDESGDSRTRQTNPLTNSNQSIVWILLVLIVAALVYFLTTEQYFWLIFSVVIGIIILFQLEGFDWRKHLLPIVAGILLLGSWIVESRAEPKWKAEKDHLVNWLHIQETRYIDLAQWQIAIQQYRYPYEKMQHWQDTLSKDKNYAALCRNWLEMYYVFLTIDSQITLPLTDKQKKLDIQARSNNKISMLNNTKNESLVNTYLATQPRSYAAFSNSGNQVLHRLEKIEQQEEKWSNIFFWLYVAGSLSLAFNYILKEIIKRKDNDPVRTT